MILDWICEMDAQAAMELSESFSEFRRLQAQLRTASLRAREAVSTAAWLHFARTKASTSNPDLQRRGP